jgi:lipoprotein-releasing system ATP-binding protein
MPADLLISGLSKTFHSGDETISVLRGVDLSLSRGDSLAITGPSGSGKSTLLYIVGALDTPTSGRVELFGENALDYPPAKLAAFRNSQIGFIFQEHYLLPQCTVLENVLIPTLGPAAGKGDEEARARILLKRVGLDHRLGHRPAQLSGGERQRAAICRALINGPGVVLADEPTGNLDRNSAGIVGKLLLELCRENGTILLAVTHSADFAALFPRRAELLDGQLKTVEASAAATS